MTHTGRATASRNFAHKRRKCKRNERHRARQHDVKPTHGTSCNSYRFGHRRDRKNTELTPRDLDAMDAESRAEYHRIRESIDFDIICPSGLVIIREPTEEEIDEIMRHRWDYYGDSDDDWYYGYGGYGYDSD